jgi:hypothetical protein
VLGGQGQRTIACNNQEFIIIADLMHDYIRVGSYYLLFRCKLSTLLEFKVSNSAGESEVAVDSTEVHEATSSSDTSLLAWKFKYE